MPLLEKHKPLDAAVLKQARDGFSVAFENLFYVDPLRGKVNALAGAIPADRRDFYQSHLCLQVEVHRQSLVMLGAYCEAMLAQADGETPEAIAFLRQDTEVSDALDATLRRAEYSKWAGWYQGECFVGLRSTRDRFRRLSAILEGKPVPPLRLGEYHREYPDLYRYQEPFERNFPLLYPAKREK